MKSNRITIDKHFFTQGLAHIDKPPKRLYCMGNLPQNQAPVVAIVGSRKPTSYGKEVTERLAYDLAKQGVIIVSGLALGIDAIAHRGALDGGGITVAVVATKLPEISPRTNSNLAKEIINNNGAIISEWGEDDNIIVDKWSFLARNRLVSGLADAIIVTEAAERSGTLNTAGHALAQGREIFAVPGNITSPLSFGCNNLIKQGAKVVTHYSDILECIDQNWQKNKQKSTSIPMGDNENENKIIEMIAKGVRDGDQLQQKTNIAVAEFNIALTMLEINGIIKPLGNNLWTIK